MGQHGGKRYSKFDEMKAEQVLGENPLITLQSQNAVPGSKCSHVPSCVLVKGQYIGLTFAILSYTVQNIISIYVSLEFPFCFT